MSQYQFRLGGAEVVRLIRDNTTLYADVGSVEIIRYIPDIDDMPEVTEFEPTHEFWHALIKINEFTAELTEQIKNLHLDDGAIPNIDEWGRLVFKHLPKYEEKIASTIQEFLIDLRMDTNTVFKENEELRRLFKYAYTEYTGDVPEYLCDFRY